MTRHSIHSKSGIAALEFAFALLFVLLPMFLGMIEFGRLALIHQKLDKAAASMADFVTQGTCVSAANLSSFASAVPQIMKPFGFSGSVVFSSVTFYTTPLPPCTGSNVSCIAWQQTPVGSAESLIGTAGGNATLPGGYAVSPQQNAIAAEIFFDFAPLTEVTGAVIPGLGPQQLYKVAVYKPRQGTLTMLSPSCN